MKSAATRIAHYQNRMTSSQIDPVLSAVNATAVANYAAYATDWVAKQQAVHDYLDVHGVLPYEYFQYNAAAGEFYHIEQHFSGPMAVAAATEICTKWAAMGCVLADLKAIAGTVFNIVVP